MKLLEQLLKKINKKQNNLKDSNKQKISKWWEQIPKMERKKFFRFC